jgi:hypothetical protein
VVAVAALTPTAAVIIRTVEVLVVQAVAAMAAALATAAVRISTVRQV